LPLRQALFGDERAASTGLLGVAFFFSLLVLYVLINRLPILAVGRGFGRSQGVIAGTIGPIITGWMIKAGVGTDWIIITIIPGLAIALLTFLLLPSAHQPKVAY
jgi:hypothetical protein